MIATDKGFTLSEVLVAIVVLSVGLLGLESMHIAAIQVNSIASRLTQGTTLAQGMAELLLARGYRDECLKDGPNDDDIDPGVPTSYPNNRCSFGTGNNQIDIDLPQGYDITWNVNINVPSVGVKTINIFVTWKNLKVSKSFSLSVQKSSS